MQTYYPLFRKYRPACFQDLIGQEVLVKVLSYAISNNRISPSYILSGIRGIGKTTTARIIAKTVNCSNSTADACGTCVNCASFISNNHPDVLEIDAASNTGVDDVRQIISNAEYKPILGKYKIFIIDEVHMLSKNAFNALLKTLEEPPSHALFILATTELHKVPLTIVSRCQKFDLKRLTVEELTVLLTNIAQKEGIKFDGKALQTIAHKAEGSARDALSILDQANLLAYGNSVTMEIVSKMLGMASAEEVLRLLTAIANQDPKEALMCAEALYATSEVVHIIEEMLNFISHAVKSKITPEYVVPYDIASITQQPLGRLLVLWQILVKGLEEVKMSYNSVITLEMLVVRLIYSTLLLNSEKQQKKN